MDTSNNKQPKYIEQLQEIQNGLDETFQNVSFQIDLINSEASDRHEVVSYLNDHSTRLQHLLDEEPRLMRWWFKDFDTALSALAKISGVKNLSHRMICIERKTLFFQLGDF